MSQWTNWDIEADKDSGLYDNKMSRGTLLCKNLVIEPHIEYFTSEGNMYSVNLDIESITDEEVVFIRDAIAKARNEEEQKKRQTAENSNAAQKKRMEEENRVREPFKP